MIIKHKDEDLMGKRFGKLVVYGIEYKYDSKNHRKRFCKCHCDCGNDCSARVNNIISGVVKSCGCMKLHPRKRDNKILFSDGELIGKRFGKLTIHNVGHKFFGAYNKRYAHCICDCGKEIDVRTSDLYSGRTKSCGCFKEKSIVESNVYHGQCYSRLYRIHSNIIDRCYNEKSKIYKYYGGRGIKVCDEWNGKLDKFVNFYNWSINNGYNSKLTIDRIDVNGDYSPENCRWVDMHIQNVNKRLQKRNNSGYVNVYWNKLNKKWRSYITVRGKRLEIGSFKSKREALEARNKFIIENNLTEYKIQEWKGE